MHILIWYILIQVLALSTFQYLFKIFKTTRDQGYGISKVMGVLIVPYLMWVAAIFHIAKYTTSNLIIITLVFCFSAILIGINQKAKLLKYIATRKKYLIITELLFLCSYLFFISIASYSQYAKWGERNMDVSFIWSMYKTITLPPQDPWLCNLAINYHYFGHFIIASLSKLVNITPDISYTLSIGMLPALFIVACFALVYEMTLKVRYALLGVLILGFAGNNFLLNQLLEKGLLFPQNVLFQTARVIPYTSNDYPFFSFVIGEVQADSIILPIIIAFLYTLYKVFKDEVLRNFRYKDCLVIMLIGFLLSVIFFTNTWDFSIYLILTAFVLLLDLIFQIFTSMRERSHRNYVPPFIELQCAFNMFILFTLIALFGYVFFIPFGNYMNIGSASFELLNESTTTNIHLLILFGLYIFVILVFAAASFVYIEKKQYLKETAIFYLITVFLEVLLVFLFYVRHIISFPKLVLLMIIFLLLAGFKRMMIVTDKRLWFCSGITLVGLLLVLGGEVFYVKTTGNLSVDVYHSTTISKFHLQALVLMGCALPFFILLIMEKLKLYKLSPVFLGLFIILLGLHLVYPIGGALQKVQYFKSKPALNSTNYIATLFPSIYKSIIWVNSNIAGQVTMLESFGEVNSKWGMLSTYTGNPTIIQWPKNLYQRGYSQEEIEKRAKDADQIYSTSDFTYAYSILQKYKVRYVFVGELEKERYPKTSLDKFSKYCKKIYDENNSRIYQIPEE